MTMETDLRKHIEEVLEKNINPVLAEHMGGAVLGQVSDGVAYIKFTGSCRGCYAAEDTMENIVKPMLLELVPELKEIYLDDSVSDELLDFARGLLRKDGK